MGKAVDSRLEAAAERVRADSAAARDRKPAAHHSRAGSLLALQRKAGNAAVTALLSGKAKTSNEERLEEIGAALKEVKKSEPDIDKVEKGLKATKAAGVPVDLDGEAQKPPPGALEVIKTGFGPGAVPGKKPVPPPGKVPPKSPLATSAKAPPKPKGKGKGAEKGGAKGGGAKGGATGLDTKAGGGPASGLDLSEAAPSMGEKALEPPVKPTPVSPEDDPGFVSVAGKAAKYAKGKKSHPPAASKAKEAQAAALAPADDVDSQAKAAKTDTMDAQHPGTFDKKAFISAVKTAIEAKTPKTLKEADEYKESGKAAEVQGDVKGMVTEGKESSEQDIAEATDAPPDASKAVPKAVTPMGPEKPGKPSKINTAAAVPKPAPPEQTNLEKGKHDVNSEMDGADVDEQQLAKSNEPEFEDALAAKKEAAEHAETAPAEFRKEEKQTVASTKQEADGDAASGMAAMHGSKAAALKKVVGDKGKAKSEDEKKRAEVTAKIQSIYDATEADVNKVLDGIDPKVDKAFTAGETAARVKFERFVAAKMAAYKKDRYGGWLGGLRWAKDKLVGMPSKVNEFFEAGRELYLKEMDKVISNVADIVGNDLNAAKARIAKGRQEIAAYVKQLPADLQKVGKEAADDIGDQFDQLESDVDSKQDELVDSLANKYAEARKGLDERIEQLQEENKGLVDKAVGAVKAVINTIKKLKDMLLGVLAKAASVIGKIIKDPIGFLKNLIAGVKGGILKFKDNILEHLKKGLMRWLFGQLADAGVELPDSFDIKGIVKLLSQLFGLTWSNIRRRLVKNLGEKAVGVIEKGVDIFAKLAKEGPAGLWQMIVAKIGDVKDKILSKVKEFVRNRIIIAGITWLIGLLNPAAAFIKACKLIYDVVMFFVQNASRIGELVNTILDSVGAIASGAVGGVVNKIEQVLSQMLPIIIGFLASVLSLGGIGKKMRGIVQSLKKPVNKAVDAVVKTGLKLAKPLLAKIAKGAAWVKGKAGKAKAWAKSKVEAGKAWAKGKVEAVKGKLGRREEVDVKRKAARLLADRTATPFKDEAALAQVVKEVHDILRPEGLKQLRYVPDADQKGRFDIVATASPPTKVRDDVEVETPVEPNKPLSLDMTPEELRASPAAQRELFALAQQVRARQAAFASGVIGQCGAAGTAESILKRDNLDAFVDGVVGKCERNGYKRIGQMDDMVRGRFNMKDAGEVRKVRRVLEGQAQFKVKEVARPRRAVPGAGHGYPRYHIIFVDPSGLTHEWQVGTDAVTKVFQTLGIEIPTGMELKKGMREDLHDIEYDILKKIAEIEPEFARSVGIPPFRAKVDRLAADAGTLGDETPRLQERILELHADCFRILQKVVDAKGTEYVKQFYH